jgi:general secretion pathway protein A
MFKEYYGLRGDPFRLSPDRSFCYRYPSFAKGRAYMQYALQAAEGFVVITGMPGMGKTTLINDLLADYGPRDYTVATMVNTMLEATEILRSAAYEFGLGAEGLDTATLLQRLKVFFTEAHRAGRPPLLVVDEAQNLSLNALEELRMLTNLQYQGKPLLQIFLVGQDELREKLQDPRLEQLRQRVTAAAHLQQLDQEQTAAYILHRLKVVGWNGFPRLKSSLLPVIEAACDGVPRRINQFCSRLLLHGAVEQKSVLDAGDARLVFAELAEERLSTLPAEHRMASEYLDDDVAAGQGASDDVMLEPDRDGKDAEGKVVMPPPRVEPPPTTPSHPEMVYSPAPPLAGDRSTARAPDLGGGDYGRESYGPPPESRPLPGPIGAPPPRPTNLYPGPPPPRQGPWLAFALVFALLLGGALFAWIYTADREDPLESLGRDIDAYLNSLSQEAAVETPGPPEAGGADSTALPPASVKAPVTGQIRRE